MTTVRDLWDFRVKVAVATERKAFPAEFLCESHNLREAIYEALREQLGPGAGTSPSTIPPDTELGQVAQARFEAWQAYLRRDPAFAEL